MADTVNSHECGSERERLADVIAITTNPLAQARALFEVGRADFQEATAQIRALQELDRDCQPEAPPEPTNQPLLRVLPGGVSARTRVADRSGRA